MKFALMVMATSAIVSGCAAQKPIIWSKPGATQSEFNQDAARCDYETSSATQNTDASFRSGLGQELDRVMRKKELYGKCMIAKGYSAT